MTQPWKAKDVNAKVKKINKKVKIFLQKTKFGFRGENKYETIKSNLKTVEMI